MLILNPNTLHSDPETGTALVTITLFRGASNAVDGNYTNPAAIVAE